MLQESKERAHPSPVVLLSVELMPREEALEVRGVALRFRHIKILNFIPLQVSHIVIYR